MRQKTKDWESLFGGDTERETDETNFNVKEEKINSV